MTEREFSPERDFQVVDNLGFRDQDDASRDLIELTQQTTAEDQETEGQELERRNSQWVFPIFGRRREGSDNH